MNDVTIIIQGPLHDRSLDNIENYQKFGKVIVSCWRSCDINRVPEHIQLVVTDGAEYDCGRPRNRHNLYKQALTTYHGLLSTRTEFAIKVRSDEYYKDLTYLIDNLRTNPCKVMVGNTFFGRNEWDFSDHIYAARTHVLIQALSTVISYCEEKDVNFYCPRENCNETILLWSLLRAIGKEGISYKDAMLDHCILCPSHFLGDFFAVSNLCNLQFTPQNVEDEYLTIHNFNHLQY